MELHPIFFFFIGGVMAVAATWSFQVNLNILVMQDIFNDQAVASLRARYNFMQSIMMVAS